MIKDLPIELPERICKEFISAKIKERKALGWLKIHYHLLWAPVHKQLLYFTAKRFCKQVTVHIALMLPIVFFLKVRGDAQIKIGKTVGSRFHHGASGTIRPGYNFGAEGCKN